MKGKLLILGLLACAISVCAEGPVMGWSSWNTYRVNINDSLIYSQAEALVKLGLDTVGYRYVNIDDGFFGGRDAETGELKFHPHRFPNGLTDLVRKIHALGLKAGIYSDAGRNTCGNFWDNDTIAENVGLYGHEVEDCKLLFDSIGFDRIKVDFCGGDSAQNSHHLSLSPRERYISVRHTLDSLGHKDVKIGACRWAFPGTWVNRVASDWRISADINCSWESVKHIIWENMYLGGYSSYGHYNDMDMLEIGRGLKPEEERTHFGMWCMMNSPLLIGCDLNAIPQESLALLKNKELIALNQDSLAEQAYPVKKFDGGCVFVRDLEQVNGKKRAVAFYNYSDEPVSMEISSAELLFDGAVKVRDLFTHNDLGEVDKITVEVEPHNTYIYLVEGTKRIHRSFYEAESADMYGYQEIEDPIEAGTPLLVGSNELSGGVAVANAWLATFDKVYVDKDGEYTIKLGIDLPNPAIVSLMADFQFAVVRETTTNGFEEVEVMLPLKAGINKITINSLEAPMHLDYLKVMPN